MKHKGRLIVSDLTGRRVGVDGFHAMAKGCILSCLLVLRSFLVSFFIRFCFGLGYFSFWSLGYFSFVSLLFLLFLVCLSCVFFALRFLVYVSVAGFAM